MSLYDRLGATAARLLAKYGRPVTFVRVTGGTEDPVAGTITGATTTNVPANVVEYPYTTGEIDGTLVVAGDKRLYSDTEVLMGDKVEGMRVVKVDPLRPGPTTLLYTIQLRV